MAWVSWLGFSLQNQAVCALGIERHSSPAQHTAATSPSLELPRGFPSKYSATLPRPRICAGVTFQNHWSRTLLQERAHFLPLSMLLMAAHLQDRILDNFPRNFCPDSKPVVDHAEETWQTQRQEHATIILTIILVPCEWAEAGTSVRPDKALQKQNHWNLHYSGFVAVSSDNQSTRAALHMCKSHSNHHPRCENTQSTQSKIDKLYKNTRYP